VSSVHRADDPRVLTKECATLADGGYDVRLVTPEPRIDPPAGVTHVVVPRRAGRLARLARTVPAVYRAARSQRAEVYHLHDPELLPIGLLLRRRGRVVYDAHEDLGNQVRHKPWIPPLLRGPIGWLAGAIERAAARRLSAVVVATPTIARRIAARPTVVVRNLARLEEFGRDDGSRPHATRDPVVAYVGSVSVPRGAREMVRALGALPARSGARLRIGGEFSPPELRSELAAMPGWERVEALGWLDRRGVAALLGSARVGLVCLHPTPSYLDSYPVKLFEYMAAGLPVVASDFPLWRSIVAEAGCGILVDPLDPEAIAGALERLLADPGAAEEMGRRGRAAVEERWSWEPEGRKLLALYASLTARRAGSGP
jgi:glycosyltransferase involved in cell wall biosynthesis